MGWGRGLCTKGMRRATAVSAVIVRGWDGGRELCTMSAVTVRGMR